MHCKLLTIRSLAYWAKIDSPNEYNVFNEERLKKKRVISILSIAGTYDIAKAFYVKYMVIIGTMGQVMHYIQAWKIFTTKSASDISLAAYVISFFLLLNWMIYGVIISSKPLIYAEITGLIGALIVIVGVITYS